MNKKIEKLQNYIKEFEDFKKKFSYDYIIRCDILIQERIILEERAKVAKEALEIINN